MSSTPPGSGPDDEGPSWAAESLPMSVRKELLERELRKLGFRRAEAQGSAMTLQQQQQPQAQRHESAHPQADGEPGEHGG
jgi:hypothetical protein